MKRISALFTGLLLVFFSCLTETESGDGTGKLPQAGPAVNQAGYLPGSEMTFSLPAEGYPPGSPFYVVQDGRAVWEGVLPEKPEDDREFSGRRVYRVSFSGCPAAGKMRIRTDGMESPEFSVAGDVYRPVFGSSFRTFSLVRANTEVRDRVTGLVHRAGHSGDFDIRGNDYSGGWYNAGDYGKWTHCSSIAVSDLLWLYVLGPECVGSDDLHIPESGNGVPDLLDEARWGLEWLLKMQYTDGGSLDGAVYHKVDTEPDFSWGLPPDADPLERSVKWTERGGKVPSTVDAADFAGVMFLASRVFAPWDEEFAGKCRSAAERSWAWVVKNPGNPQLDPYYADPDPSGEVFWAAAEALAVTGSPEARIFVDRYFPGYMNPPGWQSPEFYGFLTLLYAGGIPEETKTAAADVFLRTADFLTDESESHPYGHTLSDFWWGSNFYILGSGLVCTVAFDLDGDIRYRNAALSQLNYLLGQNALGYSFVTGFGEKSVVNPYHWTTFVYNIVIPGWVTGGPNRYPGGADPLLKELQRKGTPPALCYLDECRGDGSWASNEGTLAMTGALVFLSGLYCEVKQ